MGYGHIMSLHSKLVVSIDKYLFRKVYITFWIFADVFYILFPYIDKLV